MGGVRQLYRALLDVLLPPLCHICRTFIPAGGELHICPECRDTLPRLTSPFCPVCGVPFTGAGADHRCGSCLTTPPRFDSARAPYLYEGAIRDMIHSFKYSRLTHLRLPLALLTVEGTRDFVAAHNPQLIIPVPLHVSRLRQRGFNQAVLLGRVLSRHLMIPLVTDGLQRTRATEPQLQLSAADRHENVKGAFAVRRAEAIAGRRVLLIDDVMTTGSTINECARELKRAGAAQVTAVTTARTPR